MFAQTIGGLDEVFLDVADLPAMRQFYTEVLGFEEEFYHEGEMLVAHRRSSPCPAEFWTRVLRCLPCLQLR